MWFFEWCIKKNVYSNNYFIENNNIFDKKIKINNIYYPQNSNKNNDIRGIKNNIYKNKVNKIINNNYYNNLYNSIKYEDLIILEDKIINIIFSLNKPSFIGKSSSRLLSLSLYLLSFISSSIKPKN